MTFGVSFADHIDSTHKKLLKKTTSLESIELTSSTLDTQSTLSVSIWKQLALKTIFFLLILIIFARAVTLQIIKGNHYKALADNNRIIKRPLHAARGVIIDKKGVVLVRNTPYYKLKNDDKRYTLRQYQEKISTNSAESPGATEIESVREYQSSPHAFSHILGYISSVSQEELQESKKLAANNKIKYSASDSIGRTGIEEQYEQFLKGKDGSEMVQVDSNGNLQKTVGQIPPTPGFTIGTSIDSQLQKFAHEKLEKTVKESGGKSGVIIIQNPQNGQILTMTSYPSFDNNLFTHDFDDGSKLSQLFVDTTTPLLNRAISGEFAPGSTYKIVTSLAGLESRTITPASQYDDSGNVSISGITFNNWYFTQYGKVEGAVDLRKALARSNDTFYYKLALAMGPEKLVEESSKFKFGQQLGIDIPGEATGLIPTPQWKQKTQNEVWYPGNTINMSIGQGDVLATPLQINTMTSIIAAMGVLHPPTIVNRILDADGNILCKRIDQTSLWQGKDCENNNKSQVSVTDLKIDKEHLKAVREGMQLVNKKGGTAYPFFDFPIDSAGKTGTAETIPGQQPHAWYTGFAPYENAEITVTVLIEKGGEGSKVAAPLAKEMMEQYFKNKSK